jgi:glycosyltransferase involved in cell wall biosynthesis
MKILYDYQMFSIQKFGGVTRYFCEVMKNIPPEHQFKLSVIFSDNQYLKENYKVFKKINILPDKNFKGKYFIEKNLTALNLLYSRKRISSNNFDLFHPTYYGNYFFNILKKPYILTVHDLILFKFDDPFFSAEKKMQMENAIKKANRIIAISENTKKDLVEILNINPGKIDVVYHGYNKAYSYNNPANYGKYILFVGRRGLYKNFRIFVKAASKLLNKERNIKLICVGSPFDLDEMKMITALGISNQTMAISVDDDSLNSLYANALAFVFPSLYEGFGMPILEAFANDCPVCLSDASCFPEIAGNAGVYFDPKSEESILNSIEKIIYNNEFTKEIIKAGQLRLKEFSWRKTAKETISSYLKTI